MRLLLALALLPTVAAADVVQPPGHGCRTESRIVAAAQAGQSGFERLDRLPPAAAYLALFRTVDGCPKPVVVRAEIGAVHR